MMKYSIVLLAAIFLSGCIEDKVARSEIAALQAEVDALTEKLGRNQYIDNDPLLSFRITGFKVEPGSYSDSVDFSYTVRQGLSEDIGDIVAEVKFLLLDAQGQTLGDWYELINISGGIGAGSVTMSGKGFGVAKTVNATSYNWWLDNTVPVASSVME